MHVTLASMRRGPKSGSTKTSKALIYARLREILDTSNDERAIHAFLLNHSWILNGIRHHLYCFDRVRLGPRYVTDLVLLSIGNTDLWSLIELESPSAPIFTKAGLYSRQLNTAVRQLTDWTIWMDDFNELSGEFLTAILGCKREGIIIIGRRAALSTTDRRRLLQVNSTVPHGSLQVYTYDQLLDFVQQQNPATVDEYLKSWNQGARKYLTPAEFRSMERKRYAP